MSGVALPAPVRSTGSMRPKLPAELALGAAYWAAFLLALEPSNALRAAGAGHPLALEPEVARIAGASLLGAASTPATLFLARRFPVVDTHCWRNVGIQVASVVALTLGLITLSCLLAGLGGFDGSTDIPDQLAENGLLVGFCLAGFLAVADALHPRSREQDGRREPGRAIPASPFLTQIPVKTRGRVIVVPLDQVDWIETQGNYLALHAGPAVHLIRETSTRLEPQLDPTRFARIHRRTLVALDRIRELKPLAGGDAELLLSDGAQLRLSRSYRGGVQDKLLGVRGTDFQVSSVD